MTTLFEHLLETLSDEAQQLPLSDLAELSDLDTDRTAQFSEVWEHLSDERRRTLIIEFGRQAEKRIDLIFEPINRLAISDPDAEVRKSAINNLWECEDPTLVPPYLDVLTHDPASEVRAAAAKALGIFVWLGEIEQLVKELLGQIEQGLLSAIVQDADEEVRRRSLESLGFSSRSEVPALIEQAYTSGDEALIQSALLAMGRSVSDQWAPQVLTELYNPAPSIRLEAARAAGELELRESIESLIDLLDDVDNQPRKSTLSNLSRKPSTTLRSSMTLATSYS
jgi:HEAT repeat protein